MARRRTSARRGGFSRDTGNLGVNETVRQLREIGEHVVQAAKSSLAQGAADVVTDAKNRCPVRTGKLRDSIKAEAHRDGASYKISANAQNNGFYYGQIVEFSPKEGYRPFLYPALEANVGRIYSNVRDSIRQAVETGHA